MSEDNAIGKTYREFHSASDTQEFFKKVEEVYASGAPLQHEHKSHRDGKHFLRALSPIIGPDGRTEAVTVVSADITDMKQAEEALRESEAFLKTMINAIPTPVFYKDRDGKYLGFNSAFETFFGATRERLIDKSVFDINPPELAEIYHSQDNELFNSGGTQLYESQWKNAHGELRDFIFSKAVFTDSKGTITGLIGVLTDITDRKWAEKALKEK